VVDALEYFVEMCAEFPDQFGTQLAIACRDSAVHSMCDQFGNVVPDEILLALIEIAIDVAEGGVIESPLAFACPRWGHRN
jgi:hypothetical protein